MGVSLNTDDGRVLITGLIDDSPGWHQGLSIGDVIVALDGIRFDGYPGYREEYDRHQPGDTIRVTVVRNGVERTIPIIQTSWPLSTSIVRVEDPTSDQQRVYECWLRIDPD